MMHNRKREVWKVYERDSSCKPHKKKGNSGSNRRYSTDQSPLTDKAVVVKRECPSFITVQDHKKKTHHEISCDERKWSKMVSIRLI